MKYKNNPLNLRDGQNWLGLADTKNGFCEFDSIDFGLRAALCVLRSYQNRGKLTLKDIIYTWAPPSENNSSSYLDFVRNSTLFPYDWKLDVFCPVAMFRLLSAMCKFESNFTLGYETFDKAYSLFIYKVYIGNPDLFSK